MNSTQFDIVKELIARKKYDVITEYAHVCYPDKGNIIIDEYNGHGVRAYKDNKGNTRLLCPKELDVIQEGHVAQAIANGTIFDDADEIDRNASMIERTTLPYDAMINSGKDTPKQIRPMIAIVIGKMDDNGSFEVSDADRTNGTNFIRDLCDKEKCPNTTNVVDNYIDKPKSAFYSPEMGKSLVQLDKEVDNIVDTNPEDVVSYDDTVDSYDGYDMNAIESDPEPEPETVEDDTTTDEENESDDDDDNYDDENGYDAEPDPDDESTEDESDDDSSELSEEESEEVQELEENEDESDDNEDDNVVEEYDHESVEKHDWEYTPPSNAGAEGKKPGFTQEECDDCPKPLGDRRHAATSNVTSVAGKTQPAGQTLLSSLKPPEQINQEGFLTKKPKKLKPIGRDVVAYITCEMNDIHSANDQAMLAGYTCSKIELVDFYLTCLETNDARYIVPHNKQYLVQMKRDLENLLTQILRIRPINRTEQIWRVNYPTT